MLRITALCCACAAAAVLFYIDYLLESVIIVMILTFSSVFPIAINNKFFPKLQTVW